MPELNQPTSGVGIGAEPEYLTKEQTARWLGVSPRTVDTLLKQRRIPVIRFSNRLIRFPRAAVRQYLDDNMTVRARGK